MARPDMALTVVGAIHTNTDGSNRLFEIALCSPGEAVTLALEPTHKQDPSAVAVFSARVQQIGYLSAERCGWIGAKIRLGEDLCAVFQEVTKGGALIRVSFTGEPPILPPPQQKAPKRPPPELDDGYFPDEIWPATDGRRSPDALHQAAIEAGAASSSGSLAPASNASASSGKGSRPPSLSR